jgi:hypothetical protein
VQCGFYLPIFSVTFLNPATTKLFKKIVSMHLPHFPETTFIRFKALIALTVADICLVHDKWLTFTVLLVIAIALEFLYRSLHEVLLHNHEIEKATEKIAQRKAHQKAMEEAGVHH